MTTIVAVKKGGTVAIAADSLTTFGDTRLGRQYKGEHDKISVYSYREVFDYDRFWGIGSGRNFALGAMFAAYDRCKTAAEVARIGVMAGAEFDTATQGPIVLHTVKLSRKSK